MGINGLFSKKKEGAELIDIEPTQVRLLVTYSKVHGVMFWLELTVLMPPHHPQMSPKEEALQLVLKLYQALAKKAAE